MIPKCTKLLKRMYRIMIFVSMPVKNQPTAATYYTRAAATPYYTRPADTGQYTH